ncbi:Ldh family oxidoreductase [Thermanaerosceptrum fracticalcis]|uniref:Ldh family oxidoreductase n=1 Tax=Thermanaerosceptrum fracticalcis TaxID=1712410 RepID=UPI000557E6B5|nr:Ldh family oxidoreductase [Thermanaerosceptrum fracticalcis]
MADSKLSSEKLKSFCITLLRQVDVPEADAEIVADNLVSADLRGIASHGVSRLPIYIKRIQLGLVNPCPRPRVIKATPTSLLIDGDNGLGQVIGFKAMNEALALARAQGQALVGVNNTNHIGIGAYYALQAVREDMIGICLTNASAHMAPWGGIKPLLGTNPIAVAVPAGDFPPVVLDMATSIVARGKILLAAKKGEKIPLGWALDKNGNPTEDPNEAIHGSVLPLGGPKGYGLSLMVDILAGVLTGAFFGGHVPSMTEDFTSKLNEGIFLGAFKVDNFMPVEFFKKRMDQLISELKDSPKAPGVVEIFMPGEIEYKCSVERLKAGIPLNEEVRNELNKLAKSLKVEEEI